MASDTPQIFPPFLERQNSVEVLTFRMHWKCPLVIREHPQLNEIIRRYRLAIATNSGLREIADAQPLVAPRQPEFTHVAFYRSSRVFPAQTPSMS